GRIYPINPKGGRILDLPVYSSLTALPETPDLVIVVVPAQFVAGVLREAGRLGIKGGLILSAGFREAGRLDLEEEIAAVPREYGLRFVGPNVQGLNYLPNKMCAMFFPVIKTRGRLGIISQSGTVTAALSEWADDEGLGISAAINLGNQVDLCESDYLDYLAGDDHTSAVAMYIEGLKDGRRFISTLKRVTPQKPVVILKGGRTAAGRKSAASHTGSLAGDHAVFAAACHQFGAVIATDLETLYDAAKALTTLRPLRGRRVLMTSTSGGAGTLGMDEIESQALAFPEPAPEFLRELAGLELPPLARPANPFDLATVFPGPFGEVFRLADRLDLYDLFLLCFGDPVVGGSSLAMELNRTLKAPLAVVYFGGGAEEKAGRVEMHRAGIPVYPAPERAIRGIGAAAAYWRDRGRRQSLNRP
ncbi:MAG: CoA-binding protein, partial [Thermodesulfobacteriota bacterium]